MKYIYNKCKTERIVKVSQVYAFNNACYYKDLILNNYSCN